VLAWVVAMLVVPPSEAEWLRWRAPASCPDAARVHEAITARLGRELDATEIEVDAVVQDRGSNGLALTLRTTRAGIADARELTSGTCDALVDATALVVAVAIDPIAAVTTLQAIRAAEPAPEAPAIEEAFVPPPAPIPEAVPERPKTTTTVDAPVPRRRRLDVLLAASGGVETGAMPGPSGGPNVAVAIAWPRARIEVAGFYLAPRDSITGEGTVRVQMGVMSARACGRLRSGRFEAPLCAGLEIGASRGDGIEVVDPRTAHGRWIAPAASAGALGWVTPRVALGARVELAIPVDRTGFDVRDPGDPIPLHEPGPVSARLWAGIEVKLWGRDGSGRSRRDHP
jgi:hypothetical protein